MASGQGRPVPEGAGHRREQEDESQEVIETQLLAEIEPGEGHENAQSDDFLDNLELVAAEMTVTDAVGRDLEAILGQSDAPARQDRDPQG